MKLRLIAPLAALALAVPSRADLVMITDTAAGEVKSRTTLVSLKEQKVDPAVFKVPGDYKTLGQ